MKMIEIGLSLTIYYSEATTMCCIYRVLTGETLPRPSLLCLFMFLSSISFGSIYIYQVNADITRRSESGSNTIIQYDVCRLGNQLQV